MQNTLHNGDRMFINKMVSNPQRGDVIVFTSPASDEVLVKRVVGLPGERVRVSSGQIYINDVLLDEPYLSTTSFANYVEVVVAPDSYYVMGDNRGDSVGSHIFGAVPKDNIIGKSIFIIWPISNWGDTITYRYEI